MASKKIITLENIAFSYRKGYDVLHGVSFSITEGDIVLLIGPNGSGKTTLLKGMMGLLKPRTGNITIDGDLPKNKRDIIGYVPQRVSFDTSFPITVREFLSVSYRSSLDRMQQVLNQVGAGVLLNATIGTLSGGQFQRVLIARALLGNPKILFLDEPVSGIDIGGEENFYKLIQEIQNLGSFSLSRDEKRQ